MAMITMKTTAMTAPNHGFEADESRWLRDDVSMGLDAGSRLEGADGLEVVVPDASKRT